MSAVSSILLIGPAGVGKSTQGTLLARALGKPNASLDTLCFGYYAELSEVRRARAEIEAVHGADCRDRHGSLWFVVELRRRLSRHFDNEGWPRFKEIMELHALRRVLEDHDGAVIDFGAGHSVFSCDDLRAAARELLAGSPFVVLLMPSPDVETSVELLRRNLVGRGPAVSVERIRYYVTHPSNRDLATHTVFTEGRTPDEVCDQLVHLVR